MLTIRPKCDTLGQVARVHDQLGDWEMNINCHIHILTPLCMPSCTDVVFVCVHAVQTIMRPELTLHPSRRNFHSHLRLISGTNRQTVRYHFLCIHIAFKMIYYSEEALATPAGSSGSQGFCLAECTLVAFVRSKRWGGCQVGSFQYLCSSGFCHVKHQQRRVSSGK